MRSADTGEQPSDDTLVHTFEDNFDRVLHAEQQKVRDVFNIPI